MDNVTIPRTVWEQVLFDLSFLKKAIVPLAKGFKPEKWMNADEVMEVLEIKETRLKQLRASGQIRYQKAGRHIEYMRADIDAYRAGNIIIPKKEKPGATNTGIQ